MSSIMKLKVPKSYFTDKKLNELLSLVPPKVRKPPILMAGYREGNSTQISNHTDHQLLAGVSSAGAQNDELDDWKKIYY